MDGAGAGGAAPERRKQLTAAEAVNHKRQLAQMVERELALTGADSVTDFDDALQMVIVETAFGRYPKHLLARRLHRQGGGASGAWRRGAVVETRRNTASRHQRNTWGMLVRRAMRSTSRGRLPSILVSLVLATMQTTCSPPEKHQKVRHTKRQYRLQQQSSTAI